MQGTRRLASAPSLIGSPANEVLDASRAEVRWPARARLLRLAPITGTIRPRTARLMKRLQQIEELPAAEQRAVLKMVDALLEHRRAMPALARAERKAS